jgi:hypothetical protein
MVDTMTRLDDLPPDQRAALSLFLRQRKTYADVAALLQIPETVVRERAYAALDALAGAAADARVGGPSAEQRAEIGDYLLGQQSGVAERLRTRTYLDGSAPAREWAIALAAELAPVAPSPLPEIPAGPPAPAPEEHPLGQEPAPVQAAEPAPPGPSEERSQTSSKVGGALLLTAIVAGVIVAVVLATGGGGGGANSSASTPAAAASTGTGTTADTAPASTAASGSTGSTGAAPSSGPTEQARIALTSPDPSSKSVGVAAILSEGHQLAFYLAAERMPPTKGFFYAVWLYNSTSSFEALGKSPPVTSDGRMQGGALLPANAGNYHRMIVTRETSEKPTHPGPIVLSGAFKLKG